MRRTACRPSTMSPRPRRVVRSEARDTATWSGPCRPLEQWCARGIVRDAFTRRRVVGEPILGEPVTWSPWMIGSSPYDPVAAIVGFAPRHVAEQPDRQRREEPPLHRVAGVHPRRLAVGRDPREARRGG